MLVFVYDLIVLFSLATLFSLFYLGLLAKIGLLVSDESTILLFSDKRLVEQILSPIWNDLKIETIILIQTFLNEIFKSKFKPFHF